jgi:Porin PorA
MRRNIGLVLAGLGAFLIVLAVVLPTWIVGQVAKFPLNEYQTATLTASNASYFSATSLTEKTGVDMQATYTIKGDGPAGTDSTAVWNEYSYVYDKTNRQPVQQMTRRFAFDRKTGELTMCCGANVNGDSSIQQRGLVGYVFPIGTKKQTYQVFDTTLNKPVPFSYAGTATVGGIKTYKFTENVPPTRIGFSPLSSTQPEYYQIHLTYWVDPETGALLNVNEDQKVFLRDPATGAQTTVLFAGDLQATPASVAQIVKLDSGGRSKLWLLGTILPVVIGIVGAAALAAGILLARQAREETAPASPEPADPAPAAP